MYSMYLPTLTYCPDKYPNYFYIMCYKTTDVLFLYTILFLFLVLYFVLFIKKLAGYVNDCDFRSFRTHAYI